MALDVDNPVYEDHELAGVSFDFRKAFDFVPVNVMLTHSDARGVSLDLNIVFSERPAV